MAAGPQKATSSSLDAVEMDNTGWYWREVKALPPLLMREGRERKASERNPCAVYCIDATAIAKRQPTKAFRPCNFRW